MLGRVNVVDALAVCLVVAILAAGVAFADPFGTEESATRYATIDLGTQSVPVAASISAGDTTVGDADGVTITDTYAVPTGERNATVVVRARLNGTLAERDGGDPAFEFGGSRLRSGEPLAVETAEYEVRGEVVEVAAEGETLDVGRTQVVVESTLPSAVADTVDAGDAARIAGQRVATVERAVVAPVERGTDRPALVGLTLRTISYAGETYYGDAEVSIGRQMRFRMENYTFAGTVTRRGAASPSGVPTNTTAVVKVPNVTPDVADGIQAGMVERRDGIVTARITERRAEPTPVVLTSDDGRIYERNHPRNQTLYLTVDLRTRQTQDGLRFRTQPLEEDRAVVFDFSTITVRGIVVDVRERPA